MNQASEKRFVVQEHSSAEGTHWDLMLEMGDVLWTWRLDTPPAEIKDELITAQRIPDHALRFLSYEGPVQNGTGQVTIIDRGLIQIIEQTENSLMVAFEGKMLCGIYIFCQTDKKHGWNIKKR
jgi:hypothetical protein